MKLIFRLAGLLLAGVAVLGAAPTCLCFFYQPEVPPELRE